ncbi:PREDICTED: zinc finger CCHC domain-containing protein 7-like isoform X1 [Lupinus angustifolius]|uniref:zinc finger CCHC domain-containing protein 7-like isoform X1 n=1 Tax=Lupinus angustifolius TaxID=3871 RepID=UPI00092E46E1|nr:PREDICTED: zinc finger CCHC domain-containing protein 7-like isoform X1 [Lupinus angustifolius]
MGSQDNQKANVADHKNDIELNDDAAFIPLVVLSSDGDDEEVNPDRNFVAPKADVLNGVVSITSSQQPEPVTENDCVLDEMKKTESGDQSVIIVPEEQETVKTIEATENVQLGNNIVLRKLLRGPRYFDPPDSGRGSCFNCGVEGHVALNCTEERRKKPCYVCGGLGHNAKQCTNNVSTGKNCFLCNKGGHRAKNCPEKHGNASEVLRICLKCGNSGHDMFSCKNDYRLDDLEEIRCYICKRFGHLCCANTDETRPREISCYKCGRLGHTGLACSRFRVEATGAATAGSCYKCGGEGHFSRECTSSMKASPRFQVETTGAATPGMCFKCGQEGHFARECIFQASPRFRVETTGAATPVSCYKCGQEGHFARECIFQASPRFRAETTGEATPGSCYKCGQEGHFARECSFQARKRVHGLSNTKTKRSHTEDDYMGYMSAPHQMGKTRKKKPTLMDERGFTTPKKSKNRGGWISDHYAEESEFTAQKKSKNKRGWMTDHYTEEGFSTPKKRKSRGGWMTEHPADFSPSKSGKSSWKSTGTPSIRSNNIYSHGSVSHTPRSKSSNRWNSHGGTSKSHGSKAPHHRFSASRW